MRRGLADRAGWATIGRVLLSARHLVDRLRHPRTRADDLLRLRERLGAISRADASPQEVALAAEMRGLRESLHAALRDVASCSSCAVGHPLPNGRWDGGHCCGTRTDAVYSDVEVRSLALAGTRAGDLVAPGGDHAGCAFRGESGCSLPPAHRPSLCVTYVCRELQGELEGHADRDAIRALKSRLDAARRRFLLAVEAREAERNAKLEPLPRPRRA